MIMSSDASYLTLSPEVIFCALWVIPTSESPNPVNRTAGTVAVPLELSIAPMYEKASANAGLYATMKSYAGGSIPEAQKRDL